MFNTNGRTAAVNNMRHNTGAAGQGAYSTAAVAFGTSPATFPASTTHQLGVFVVCHARIRYDAAKRHLDDPAQWDDRREHCESATATFSEAIDPTTLTTGPLC